MTVSDANSAIPHAFLSLAGETVETLNTQAGYQFSYLTTEDGVYEIPADIPKDAIFNVTTVPGTITSNDVQKDAQLDQYDHWVCISFNATTHSNTVNFLQFDGLLTHADVFLNGNLIVQSRNAFQTHLVNVSAHLQANNQLYICFRAIAPLLAKKQARGRHSTKLVNERHLRFIRTPTLGYMLGFASATKLIGAYRPISLVTQQQFLVQSSQIDTHLSLPNTGVFTLNLQLKSLVKSPESVILLVIDESTQTQVAHYPVNISQQQDMIYIKASGDVQNVAAYWPHTHGKPQRYLFKLVLDTDCEIQLGLYGFRQFSRVDNQINMNGTPIFLRGACWTPMSPANLQTSAEDLRERLNLLKRAGINMLRIPGNMPYECDDFYQLCDALGILIFQDFAFTNFDYPDTDTDFVASVTVEATQFLNKHGNRACLSILAGNSEVAQQASMMGLDLNQLGNPIFDDVLKGLSAQFAPNVTYISSSPMSDTIPFHVGNNNGSSHYYGVGGYMRDFDDARLFKGQLIAECLAFSHVPEESSLIQFFNQELLPTHHPHWKEGVPRDNGAGWDFADITDYYVEQLFGVNVKSLRATQPQRYLDLCRAASCEVVERTMAIFRSNAPKGRAALVWLLHDLKPGAGWGYIDSFGVPKSPFYGLARASQPITVLFVDEGLEGLAVYLANDSAELLDYQLEIALITAEGSLFERATQACQLTPRSVKRISVDAFLGRFVDSSYAYRFGARGFVATVAKLTNLDGEIISQKVFVEPSLTLENRQDVDIVATLKQVEIDCYCLSLSTNKPAFFVTIDVPNCTLSDNYFHLMPSYSMQITLTSRDLKLHGRVRALNTQAVAIK
ncbi:MULTISPECIES: glycoside hydrolase family 2 protein [Methylotenera]|uniref:glycoside hydrolase family 2 protein n=1 Tax=Methylotenera TaxID=359407 RepID=UPI000362C303|nr:MULTISPECIES: glycoside hydrolase family 2 protein [Methylotenera]